MIIKAYNRGFQTFWVYKTLNVWVIFFTNSSISKPTEIPKHAVNLVVRPKQFKEDVCPKIYHPLRCMETSISAKHSWIRKITQFDTISQTLESDWSLSPSPLVPHRFPMILGFCHRNRQKPSFVKIWYLLKGM